MAEAQRKIELQSPEDLRYLINSAKRAAAEKIDRAFPPMANQGEDAMKIRVQELVDEVSLFVLYYTLPALILKNKDTPYKPINQPP